MSPRIGMPVVIATDLAVRFRPNGRARAVHVQLGKLAVGIEGPVGRKCIDRDVLDQRRGAFQIVSLTRHEAKTDSFPRASTSATILMVSPPRERPMA